MADGGWPAVNSDIDAGLSILGLQLPAVADGVWHSLTGATVALGSDIVTAGTAAFVAADEGKRFTMTRGGGPASFAGARIINRGAGYRAGAALTIAGAPADIVSVTATAASLVSGGTGGPPSTILTLKGMSFGRRGRRDAARIEVTTNASGVVTTVNQVVKGGAYINPAFTGLAESFTSNDFPALVGVVFNLTLGAGEIRRRAACFYGRIAGTALTVEEIVYGTIAAGHTLSGIEVAEGTTITAGAGLAWTISTAHADMADNTFLFISETPTTTTSPASGTVSPTGGTGTGLSVQPQWRGRPLVGTILDVISPTSIKLNVTATSAATDVGYCYGTDHGPAIQAALDAGAAVSMPAGIVCHSLPLTFKAGSRLVGRGSALGERAATTLAYVGPWSSRGKQLSADDDITGQIDGAVIGNFQLNGNYGIGIGYYTRGVQGAQILPMVIRGHTYIGAQFGGAFNNAEVGNVHSTLVVREDAPGYDVTGIYVGPGTYDPATEALWDTCRTFFPYWQVDTDIEGFGRPIWYRTGDSNTHGFIKCRGPNDLPGIEFGGHDKLHRFARSIHISYLDPKSARLRGGAFPSNVEVSFYSFLNGSTAADVDGTSEAAEAIEEDEIFATVDFGARFFSISNTGTLNAPRLQAYNFQKRQMPKTNSWQLVPIRDSITAIPGAEITGEGSNEVLAYTDGQQKLRVLAPLNVPSNGMYTVATLPAGRRGMRAIVSDALAPAFLANLAGGGAVVTPVFWSDVAGGAWKVG